MSGLWEQPGVPHRGWIAIEVYDLGDLGAICEMCEVQEIRYVHVMKHPDHPDLEVGCICAEHMSGDYVGPRRREADLKNRANRRKKWLSRRWKESRSGNFFLNLGGRNLGVFADPYTEGAWKWRIGSRFDRRPHPSLDAAKLALFDAIYPPGG